MTKFIDIVFDGPPNLEGPRFIEIENDKGEGIRVGRWMQRDDGRWVLRLRPEDIADVEQTVVPFRRPDA